ncbi:MAG: hypothetical protein JSR94_15850, partial [Proteobacteria bacterium]|nr:hypothetical protein [Pseudomonadota bacterium]
MSSLIRLANFKSLPVLRLCAFLRAGHEFVQVMTIAAEPFAFQPVSREGKEMKRAGVRGVAGITRKFDRVGGAAGAS